MQRKEVGVTGRRRFLKANFPEDSFANGQSLLKKSWKTENNRKMSYWEIPQSTSP